MGLNTELTGSQVVPSAPRRRLALLWGPVGDRLVGWQRAAFLAAFGVVLVSVLFLHGFLPGMSQTPLTALFATGQIQCLHDQGISSLWTWCMSIGLPIGAPKLTGMPWVYLGWLVSYVPGVDAWAAHQITMAALDSVAFVGAFLLMRRWGSPRWIALLATASYLTAANVLILNGFGYTFIGYLLVPAFVYACLRLLDALDDGRWVLGSAGAVALSLVMVFTDGYVFFSAALIIGFLVLAWVLRGRADRGWARSLGGGALWLGSLAVSALTYAAWAPQGSYETNVDFEVFGLLAVDVVTLFVPSSKFLYPDLLGIDPPVLNTWGINDTPPTHYLGYLTLAALIFYLVAGREKLPRTGRRELVVVALAGAAALLLSFGPTLKVFQVEPGLDASLLTLPTAWIHEHVPGISAMRATNRWLIVTRFAFIAVAAAGFSLLWHGWRGTSRWRAVAIIVLACLAAVETVPNLPGTVRQRQQSIDRVHLVRDGIVAEADEMLVEGETVLVLPSVNDFLANYLVPMTGTESYNVGGDKNYYLSLALWPESVRAARDEYGPESAEILCTALEHDVDAIVLPYMSPYEAPLLRPRDEAAEAERRALAVTFTEDPRFQGEVGEWLTVLRGSGVACGS